MLITERSLEKAVEMFLAEAKIPRPEGWSPLIMQAYVQWVVVPAFYKALLEIEPVFPSFNFDIKNVCALRFTYKGEKA